MSPEPRWPGSFSSLSVLPLPSHEGVWLCKVKLGTALEPHRKDVSLACKTAQRRQAEAAAELDRSLQHLRTGHFGLYQLHAVTTIEEVEILCGPGGALETLVAARRDGKLGSAAG